MTAPAHVIVVVGPPSAGVTSLAEVLAERLPEHTVVEESEAQAPDAVVFVASAVAPMTGSDVDLLERSAALADVVIGAVSKIDAHRGWRDVLAADRQLLARRDARYRPVPWVGVAAAPDLGDPNVDDLIDTLRLWLVQPDRRTLRVHADPVRRQQSPTAADAVAVRGEIQQARLSLVYFVRHRSARLGADLRAEAADLSRGAMGRFQQDVRDAAADFVAEVDAAVGRGVGEIPGLPALTPGPAVAPPALPPPRHASRRLETRLMMVLGGGFGLGVALTLSRLTSQLGPGADVAGLLVGGVAGLLLTMWVVGARGVLNDRASMDRWIGEITTTLRNCGEEVIARRLLEAEIAFATRRAARGACSRDSSKARIGTMD